MRLPKLRHRRCVALLAGVVACSSLGCGPIPDLVHRIERERFCPASRIVVKPREDLQAHHFACMKQPSWRAQRAAKASWIDAEPFWITRASAIDVECAPEPPPEIRGDPARLRIWKETRERPLLELDRCVGAFFPCTVRIVEVTACDARTFYACDRDWCSSLGSRDPVEPR